MERKHKIDQELVDAVGGEEMINDLVRAIHALVLRAKVNYSNLPEQIMIADLHRMVNEFGIEAMEDQINNNNDWRQESERDELRACLREIVTRVLEAELSPD